MNYQQLLQPLLQQCIDNPESTIEFIWGSMVETHSNFQIMTQNITKHQYTNILQSLSSNYSTIYKQFTHIIYQLDDEELYCQVLSNHNKQTQYVKKHIIDVSTIPLSHYRIQCKLYRRQLLSQSFLDYRISNHNFLLFLPNN